MHRPVESNECYVRTLNTFEKWMYMSENVRINKHTWLTTLVRGSKSNFLAKIIGLANTTAITKQHCQPYKHKSKANLSLNYLSLASSAVHTRHRWERFSVFGSCITSDGICLTVMLQKEWYYLGPLQPFFGWRMFSKLFLDTSTLVVVWRNPMRKCFFKPGAMTAKMHFTFTTSTSAWYK